MVEAIGLIASVLVVICFFLNGEKRIRTVNTIGSGVFLIYAILIDSVSLIFLNSVSVVVNLFKIYKLNRRKF